MLFQYFHDYCGKNYQLVISFFFLSFIVDYGLGGYFSAIDKKYYGETMQIEGIIDEKSRSFVLQFLEGKFLMIYNIFYSYNYYGFLFKNYNKSS